jgi:hypothetical protein
MRTIATGSQDAQPFDPVIRRIGPPCKTRRKRSRHCGGYALERDQRWSIKRDAFIRRLEEREVAIFKAIEWVTYELSKASIRPFALSRILRPAANVSRPRRSPLVEPVYRGGHPCHPALHKPSSMGFVVFGAEPRRATVPTNRATDVYGSEAG